MPTRCPPDVVLSSPHDADPLYHQDWTIVPGSNWDDDKRKIEYERRERREILIRAKLTEGFSVFYPSSGNSMWPLIQSGDFCTFHPIQAVTAGGTARGGEQITIQKERSEIGVGDVVFCQWGSSAPLGVVHEVKQKRPRGSAASDSHQPRPKYLIGDILGHITHWCNREHIFGILFDVQVVTKFCTAGTHTDEDPCGVMVEPTYAGEHTEQFQSSRPLPKTIFKAVSDLTQCSENDLARARNLCLPGVLWTRSALRQQGRAGLTADTAGG